MYIILLHQLSHTNLSGSTTTTSPSLSSNQKNPLSTNKMVNLTSIVSTIIGFAAIASAMPTLEKRAVTCREDLGSGSYGRVSRSHERQAPNKAITNNFLSWQTRPARPSNASTTSPA